MKLIGILLSMSMTSAIAAPNVDEAWTGISDPLIMSSTFVRNFNQLPLTGKAGNPAQFWSGDYWALKKGNINYRWNSHKDKGFKLVSPTRAEVMMMTQDQLASLAPSEKYDIFVGRYDYPLKTQVSLLADRRADEWEGICHGWAPATMNHNEPTPKTLVNPDGIAIPFGSADIKALISFYYAHGFQVDNTHQMGSRCFKDSGSRDCKKDLNAGAFHIVLTNRVGIEKVGFIADLDKGDEVWNHPINGFETRIEKMVKPGRKHAPGTAQVLLVKTSINYINETENFWTPVLGTKDQLEEKKKYEYEIELDSWGNIIGGRWKSGDRPDFLWTKRRPFLYEGNLSRLGELLND